MKATARHLLVILASGMTLAGCLFSSLEDDLGHLDRLAHLFAGEVVSDLPGDRPIVVVALYGMDATDIESYRTLSGPGVFEIRARARPTRFFAFADSNGDLAFQPGERFGWANRGELVDPASGPTDDLRIRIGEPQPGAPGIPAGLVDAALEEHLNNYIRPSIGNVAALDSPLFSRERAELGLWTPLAFVEGGGAGIYFLEPFDARRIPVLFVHGISGTPREFSTLIGSLDAARYQSWVLSYPSGLRLSWVARGMYQFLDVLHRQHEFAELHVVAHSMGGLVSRGAINLCAQNRSCDYLASYTTISTPWGGIDSASDGVRWAPTVIPVWRDLEPGSEYIGTLFDTALPKGLSYHLIFGYRHEAVFGAASSDGVVRLRSQLRHEARADADSIRGYDEDHTSILENAAVSAALVSILDDSRDR